MGANTKIEWTAVLRTDGSWAPGHTFNPWWGCTEVSPACDNCYARTLAKRYGFGDIWGPSARIRLLKDAHWSEPIKWNDRAARAGERRRVFCSSMADIFQGRADHAPLLARLWPLIARTEHLDWLLLTKRPTKIAQLVPWTSAWPSNVWIGTTVENQEWAEKRIPHLLALPPVVRFVSAEPLLGPIDLRPYLRGERRIDWVIAGGESGPAVRPTRTEWLRDLRDQCVDAAVPFHFKQWGTFGLREGSTELVRLGKKNAGRMLDGRTWDEAPSIAHRAASTLVPGESAPHLEVRDG